MTTLFGTVLTVVSHTPIWVWVLYALLLFLGFQRTRDSTVHLPRVLILPLVVTFLTIWSAIVAGPSALPAMALGLITGGVTGWYVEPADTARRMPGGRVWLRGEWWTFAQIVVVLLFRYAVNVAPVLNPSLNSDLVWRIGTVFISAVLSGLFLGRTAARLAFTLPWQQGHRAT